LSELTSERDIFADELPPRLHYAAAAAAAPPPRRRCAADAALRRRCRDAPMPMMSAEMPMILFISFTPTSHFTPPPRRCRRHLRHVYALSIYLRAELTLRHLPLRAIRRAPPLTPPTRH